MNVKQLFFFFKKNKQSLNQIRDWAGSHPHSARIPGTQTCSRGIEELESVRLLGSRPRRAQPSEQPLEVRGRRDLLPSLHALWPRLPAPFIEKRLSDHVKDACRLRDVTQRGPMVASVYVGGVVGIFIPIPPPPPPRCPLARVVSAEPEREAARLPR